MKVYLALIRIDLKLAFRDKSVLVFNYLFPLVFFFIFAETMHAERGGTISYVVTMVLVLGVLGNGLFGAGMRATQEREQNILRRFKVAPISALPILVASVVTGLVTYIPAVVVVFGLAIGGYNMAIPPEMLSLVGLLLLGVVAFRSIGLIVASVVNSMQEAQLLTQLLYMPMLFLSGATFPLATLPEWAQVVAQFLPASYLVTGLQAIFFRHETLLQNRAAVAALLLTSATALFIATRIFRWEKSEKLRPAAKGWVLAVLAPFFVLGAYQTYSRDEIRRTEELWRNLQRSRTLLVRGARILIGDGRTIEKGAVLIKAGKIDQVYEGEGPDAASLDADVIEAVGKTVLPGLIDVHVHLGAPGWFAPAETEPRTADALAHAAGAYLYSGVTTVRSVGDSLDSTRRIAERVTVGELLGAEIVTCGPLFTTRDGHGTEYFADLPAAVRDRVASEWIRTPATPSEARRDVGTLLRAGGACVKAVLESGEQGQLFNRLDVGILTALVSEARVKRVPISVHTGDARDVADAARLEVDSVEHGSSRDDLPADLLLRMSRDHVVYVPTLSVFEALKALADGQIDLLNRPLVQQVVEAPMLETTRKAVLSRPRRMDGGRAAGRLAIARRNLLAAYRAGVPLAAGTDSGNPLVFHGPAIHRELQLWVAAGIAPVDAIRAATADAARLLGLQNRIGLLAAGYDADLLILDGDPLTDIAATERISDVIFKGELIERAKVFEK